MLQKVMSKFGSKTVLPAQRKGSAVSESTVSLSKDRIQRIQAQKTKWLLLNENHGSSNSKSHPPYPTLLPEEKAIGHLSLSVFDERCLNSSVFLD